MTQVKIIKSCLGFLGLALSFSTFANCPQSTEVKVQSDGSHYAQTSEGLWLQIEDEQTYKSHNGVIEHPIYEFYVIAANHSHLDVYNKMICIYNIENSNFIKLVSPTNKKYSLATENNNWTTSNSELGKRAGCFSHHSDDRLKLACHFHVQPE
ncbi:hypothetical protein [Fluviispira sanaruensis]|uniref:Lipoprotein n=1 Tax=Fluviispira sanaruensis TaxID=2493639 RepID=A0A4P2VH42_FLUSA|nr:hypothetical protein [Fluviispira sanaruensis]BBH51981.1 hypothetical protein JCM31447_04130 [Fluviispira sanaruensis]